MMARPRVYRHDVRCPDCGANWMVKDGHRKGRQRYRCGECGRSDLPEGAYRRPGPAVKEQGVRLYLEGSSLSAVSRRTGYSVPAVLGWVKKGGARPGLGCGSGASGGGRGRQDFSWQR